MKIRLNPVPLISPSNFLCLELSDSNTVKLTRAPQPGILPRYFDRFTLYRSVDGSPFAEYRQSGDPTQEMYYDSSAISNNSRDYCYLMRGFNSCDEAGLFSDTICTLGSQNRDLNYLEAVSVEGANRISIEWEDFPDGFFGTYIIERRNNEAGSSYSEIARLSNYAAYKWYDEDVFTERYSYCYRLRNINYCGNESPYSNEGCSILLQGEAEQFNNNLSWNAYREWRGDVDKYRLWRNPNLETPALAPLRDLNALTTTYSDTEIPLEGGVFRYRVQATEGPGGNNAVSFSNEVELVQTPLLYLPNAFSPNGDVLNNTWGPGFAYVQDFEIIVMNRWGQVVFRTTDLDARWDGRYVGEDCAQGVYVYRIRYKGFNNPEPKVKTGTVTLLR